MIILVNGSFGIGKTTVAEQLTAVMPNALLFDPEEVGALLRAILGKVDPKNDFQDYPAWRSLFVATARELQKTYCCDLVVPMTLRRKDYFHEVLHGLKEIDANVHHFCLTAPEDEIIRRIRSRGEQNDGDWVFEQVPKCVSAFEDPAFDKRVDVSTKRPEAIRDEILSFIKGSL